MNGQGQANADLYIGIATIVTSSDDHRGHVDFSANPAPHLYLLDSSGTTSNWSLLMGHGQWTEKLHEGAHPAELSPEDTASQINDTAHLGTRVLWLGWDITAANAQWIITRAHQLGLVGLWRVHLHAVYGGHRFPGVDAFVPRDRYELGVIAADSRASAGRRSFRRVSYNGVAAERLAHQSALSPTPATHRSAPCRLMPASAYYLNLPNHRPVEGARGVDSRSIQYVYAIE